MGLALFLACALVSACGGDEAPGLEAGPVVYSASEVLGLSPSRLDVLAGLTAVGVAIQQGDEARLIEPAVQAATGERLLPDRFRQEAALSEAGVTDANLEALYATNPEYELTVRHLIVLSERYESDADRAAARDKAGRALERIRAGEPFPEVAAEVSEEPGAEGRQGLLNPGREGAWVDEFWAAASALEVGEISPVVETQYGFHVLRLEGREVVPFAEVRARVAARAAAMLPGAGGTPSEPETPAAMVQGYTVSPELATLVDGSATAARWEGGQVSVDEVRAARAGLSALGLLAGRPLPTEPLGVEQVDAAARWKILAARAEAEGVELDPVELESVREEWTDRVGAWGRQFGFQAGMSTDALKAAALEGLSATGQLFQVARREIEAQRSLLALYLEESGAR